MPQIILTEPSADPIRTYKNGVKVIRLHEFLGPARGTLSTESDSMSLCGTVIRDTQTVSYSGSNPNKTISSNLLSSGFDSVRIHESDLNLNDEWIYAMFLGLRGEGSIDPTVQNSQHDFLTIGANAATVASYSANSTFTTYFTVGGTIAPKPLTNPYYKIFEAGSVFSGAFTEGAEWLTFRAGTGTSGSFEWLLDVLYLVPYDAAPGADIYEDGHFYQVLNDADFEPVYDWKSNTYDESRDDNVLSWDVDENGQFSVMHTAPRLYCPSDSSCFADFQIGESEKTMWNVFPKFPLSPISENVSTDITLFAGSHYLPSHNIDSDIFDRVTTDDLNVYLGSSQEDRNWTRLEDHPLQASSVGSAMYCDGTQLIYREGSYDNLFPFFFPQIGDEANISDPIAVALGISATETGTGATTRGHETLFSMNHCVLDVKVTTDHILVAGFDMFAGFVNQAGTYMGVTVEIPTANPNFGFRASSSLLGGLVYYPDSFTDRDEIPSDLLSRTYIDGPTTITSGFTPNTWVRIKVEMNWYKYRGKAWIDGDAEPDWMWEGFIPSGNDPFSPQDPFLYPYEDDSDIGRNVRTATGRVPALAAFYYRPLEDDAGESLEFSANPKRVTTTYWQDFNIEYEAKGETPTDVHLNMKKHDDSVDYGSVTIPYESQRCIIGPTARYNTPDESSRDGVSLTTWKEEGAPETQAACIGFLEEKAVIGGPIWLHIKSRPYENPDLDTDEEED